MKILILSDEFPPRTIGGSAVVAFALGQGFNLRGHDVLVVTTVRDVEDAGEYWHKGIRAIAIHSSYNERWRAYRSLYNPSTIPMLKKIISKFKPDIVHAHNIHFHISYHALKLAKHAGARVILTAHDAMLVHYGKFADFIDPRDTPLPQAFYYRISPFRQLATYKRRYNPLRNLIIRYYLRFCEHICAVSNELKKALEQNGIKKIIVVHNGIDTNLWKEDESLRNRMRQKYMLGNAPTVFFAGRLAHAKGGEQIIKIMGEVIKKVPNAILLVAGIKDVNGEEMERQAKNFHLPVIFTGWLDGEPLRGVYGASTVVVFPSAYLDSFGLVNIEAMALKKPVVATCFGGAREIVGEGMTGYVRSPYDVKEFAKAIAELLTDSKKAEKFGEAGRARVEKIFTLENQINNYLKLYKSG